MGNRAGWFFGRLISIAAMILAVVFMCGLHITKMIPDRYFLIVGVVLVCLLVLITTLTWNTKGKIRFIIGLILGIVLCVAEVMGSRYVFKAVNTAQSITQTASTEVSQVGVYVKADNSDDFDSVAATYSYGIGKEVDRENTDQAWSQLKSEYSPSADPSEYDSLPKLVDAVRNGEVDAILMNTAFTAVLEEMDDYKNISEELKLVKTYDVETQIETDQEDASDALNSGYSGNTFVLYISGIDTRSSTIQAKSRSDVNILAIVNPDTHQILLVSTPRDYYVPLSISNGARDKLTHAGIYGINCSIDTMEMLYGINIDYYFRVNFTGFENIIDALGGITVESDYDFTANGYHYTKGENTLDGEAALNFVRERHAFTSGDNQRGKNQMAMIKAVINKMTTTDMLTNFDSVMDAIADSFETSMPYSKISELVKDQLDSGDEWNIQSYSVTGTGSEAVPYSMSTTAYVMIPDDSSVAKAKELMSKVYDNETLTSEDVQDTSAETETSESSADTTAGESSEAASSAY